MGHKAEEEEEKSLAGGLAYLAGADGRSGLVQFAPIVDNTGLGQ